MNPTAQASKQHSRLVVDAEQISRRKTHARQPRVLQIGPMPPPYGGIASYVCGYMQSSVTKVYDVRHLLADVVGKLSRRGLARAVLNVVNLLLLVPRLLFWVIFWRPAIVHLQTSSYGGFYEKAVLAWLSHWAGRRVVMNVHGGEFRPFYDKASPLGRRFIRSSLRMVDRLIAASPRMESTLRYIGADADRIIRIPNGINIPAVSVCDRDGDERDTVTVLFLNQLDITKGIFELTDAYALLAEQLTNLRLILTGPDGPIVPKIRRRLRERQLTGRVEMHLNVSEKEKSQLYLRSDIYALPTYVEDLPYGLLEAMSYGLAVVTTPVGGIPNVVADGESGLLVPARDVDALVKALLRLATDRAFRLSLGRMARETIVRRFDWEQRAAEIVRLYDRLLRLRTNDSVEKIG